MSATTETDKKIAIPSVLAFERKLDPSDAVFSAGNWDQRGESAAWPAIAITAKSVRGTISNRLKGGKDDPAKLDGEIQKPNLQTVDVAALPHEADTLKTTFTLRVLGGLGKPSACNESTFQNQLEKLVADYIAGPGLGELSRRYATNLANGRFLWRNRLGAEQIEIHISVIKNGKPETTWVFDAFSQALADFSATSPDIKAFAARIEDGLKGASSVLFQVNAYVRIGSGQEVYPSQELILEQEKNAKSKTLYQLRGTAAIHSQKIGNAIRTIDTWYQADEDIGPIAIEPYGSVTSRGRAYRQPKEKQDFYNLFDNWVAKAKIPTVDQLHYVIAVLIRGGVFGKAEDK
jgi:CRISPR-associated protein Csy3